MKSLLRSLFICLLGAATLSGALASLPENAQRNYLNVVARSPRLIQVISGALAQSLFVKIQASDSSDAQEDSAPVKKKRRQGRESNNEVVTGGFYKLEAGQSASGDVVLIGGTGEINGAVDGALIMIGSKASFSGTVNGDFVTIGSNLRVDPGAVANGDFVSIASEVKGAGELNVNGERVTFDTLSPAVPVLKELFSHIAQLRPMSPTSVFSWTVAIVGLLFCLLLGLLFPKAFAATDTILREQPVPSFLIGLAVIIGVTILSFLLLITVVGIIALPFLALAVFILDFFGTTAVSYCIGKRIAPHLSERSYGVYLWIAVGTAVTWVLYCIPVIGFIATGVVSLLGLGTFSIYLVERYRTTTPHPSTQTIATPEAAAPSPLYSTPLALRTVEPSLAIALPKAQFFPRLAANLIDLTVLYALLYFLHITRATIPLWVFYRFAMYAWKSSTLGQIVLNLRVQKPDGSSLAGDYSASLIRALSSLLSLLPFGLGFIWILFNRELEAWHDKISGTYVVELNPSASPSAGHSTTPPPT